MLFARHRISLCLALTTAVLFCQSALAEAPRTKIALLPLQPKSGTGAALAEIASDALAVELQQVPGITVITPKDIQAALGFEREKARVRVEVASRTGGEVCSDDSCLAEIGGALGVDLMVSGTLAKLGRSYFVTMQVFDIRKAVVLRRHQLKVKATEQDEVIDALGAVVKVLFPARPGGAPATAPREAARREGSSGGTASPIRSVMGPADAPVKIVVFSEFECPYCAIAAKTVQRLLAAYPGRIHVEWRDFPLSIHKHARRAAEAAHCAGEQDRFWELHDALFEYRGKLSDDALSSAARRAGLDSEALDACLASRRFGATIEASLTEGRTLGVTGTPTFFINGTTVVGAQPYEQFARAVDAALASKGR